MEPFRQDLDMAGDHLPQLGLDLLGEPLLDHGDLQCVQLRGRTQPMRGWFRFRCHDVLLLSLSLCYMMSVETGGITETVLCVGLLTTNSRPGAYRQDQSALSTGLVVMATGGPHYWYLVQSLGPSWQTDISQSYKLHLIATTVSLPAESSLMNLLKELRSCSTGYGLQLVAIVFNY